MREWKTSPSRPAAVALVAGLVLALSSIPLLQAIVIETPDPKFHPAFDVRLLLRDGSDPHRVLDEVSPLTHCPIHDRALKTIRVPIIYGLLAGPFPSEEDRKEFPFGSAWISGGCCLEPGDPSSARISQCGDCLLARRHWILLAKVANAPLLRNEIVAPLPIQSPPSMEFLVPLSFSEPAEPSLDDPSLLEWRPSFHPASLPSSPLPPGGN